MSPSLCIYFLWQYGINLENCFQLPECLAGGLFSSHPSTTMGQRHDNWKLLLFRMTLTGCWLLWFLFPGSQKHSIHSLSWVISLLVCNLLFSLSRVFLFLIASIPETSRYIYQTAMEPWENHILCRGDNNICLGGLLRKVKGAKGLAHSSLFCYPQLLLLSYGVHSHMPQKTAKTRVSAPWLSGVHLKANRVKGCNLGVFSDISNNHL